jgi:tRNA threonylcarbamoyladenosine biosynthesis protein TsaE
MLAIVPWRLCPVKVVLCAWSSICPSFACRLPGGLTLVYNCHRMRGLPGGPVRAGELEVSVSPVLDEHTVDFVSHSAEQTVRLGRRLGRLLEGGEVVCLIGDLGAGKTCLVQGVGAGLGIEDRITSPTFTLVNEYREGRLVLHHIDLYRISEAEAALAFGLDEYLYDDGVCAIEWAERVRDIWPEEYLLISLRHIDETKRGVTMRAYGDRYDRLLTQFIRTAFGL